METATLTNALAAVGTAEALPEFGITVPKALTDAVAAWNAANAYEGPALVARDDVSTITAAKVPALIDQAAQAHMMRDAVSAVKDEILDGLARRLTLVLRTHAEDILTAARPGFDDTVAKFLAHFEGLSDRWTEPTHLTGANPTEFAAFAGCRDLLPALDGYAKLHRRTTKPMPQDPYRATEFAKVNGNTALDMVIRGLDTTQPLGYWGHIASTPGASIHWWTSPDEQMAHVTNVRRPVETAA